MEISKSEIAAVQEVVVEKEAVMKELDCLQLALIGGGMGDIVLR
jgi:hypothetical protein